ncbi:UbiA family prenyltransferase [Streptomyces sp. NPDC058375]|uniref:UbiA family prenyltransferase n=1 Tax=Streptomyces sp. NPDC058375 TaxID=3346467 RepID=UPI0036636A0E
MTDDSLSGAGGTAPAPDRPEPPPTGRNGEQGADAAGADRAEAASGPGAGSGTGASIGSGTGAGVGSGAGAGVGSGTGPSAGSGTDRGAPRHRLRAWAELLRVSALFSVPGDALAGAAAVGRGPGRGTALAIGASLCLYEAGMALNDWADRDEDAVDRPHRPIPSGRISPAAALGAAGALTAAGLALAARAGRPALTVATGLAATVWAYDLHLKHTKAGPAAMAAARSLDLLLGATATATYTGAPGRAGRPDNVAGAPAGARAALAGSTPAGAVPASARGTVTPGSVLGTATAALARGAATPASGRGAETRTSVRGAAISRPVNGAAVRGSVRGAATPASARGGLTASLPALPAALVLGAHTYGVTAVSRHETQGGSTGTPLAVLATTTALAAAVLGEWWGRAPDWRGAGVRDEGHPGRAAAPAVSPYGAGRFGPAAGPGARRPVGAALAGALGQAAGPDAKPYGARRPGWAADLDAGLPAIPGLEGLLARAAADPTRLLTLALTAAYLRTAGPALLHAALNPSPPLTQRAVGGGIRAMIPLQAALAARSGSPVTGLAVMGLVPLARSLARKVSLT